MELVWQSHLHPDKIDAKFSVINDVNMKKIREYGMPEKTELSYTDVSDHIKYKYLICIDGFTSPWLRPNWIMASNSLLVKQESRKIDWYYYDLKPYIHYYPLANDLSNLLEVFDYLETHQEEAQKIVEEANKFVDSYFTPEALTDAICDLFREYSRAQTEERNRANNQKRE